MTEKELLEEAKVKISHVNNVEEWNEVREVLKGKYPMDVISALDASKFIKTMAWAKEPKKETS